MNDTVDEDDNESLTVQTQGWSGKVKTETMTRAEAKQRGYLQGKSIPLERAARLGSKTAKDELNKQHPVVGTKPTVPRVAAGFVLGGPIGALFGFAWRKKVRS